MSELPNNGQAEQKTEVLKKSLQRLHRNADDLSKQTQEKVTSGVNGHIKRYNDLLERAKIYFPEDELVQSVESMEELSGDLFRLARSGKTQSSLEQVKMNTLELLDILQVDVHEPAEQPGQVINIFQNAQQMADMDVEQLARVIQDANLEASIEAQITQEIKDFQQELDREKPDPSRLKEIIENVMKAGKEYAIPLLMELIKHWDKIFTTQ